MRAQKPEVRLSPFVQQQVPRLRPPRRTPLVMTNLCAGQQLFFFLAQAGDDIEIFQRGDIAPDFAGFGEFAQ
jgi:hypothetical protein